MKQKSILKLITVFLFMLIVMPVLIMPLAVNADSDTMWWGGKRTEVELTLGLGNEDPREIAGEVINVALGFLGIIAVLIVIYGGFKWMTAGGNEDGITEAKKIITAGAIGLAIILAAWGLATFITNVLYDATGAEG